MGCLHTFSCMESHNFAFTALFCEGRYVLEATLVFSEQESIPGLIDLTDLGNRPANHCFMYSASPL